MGGGREAHGTGLSRGLVASAAGAAGTATNFAKLERTDAKRKDLVREAVPARGLARLRGDDHGGTRSLQIGDGRLERPSRRPVEKGGRLVEHQQARPPVNGAGELDAASLAAREAAGALADLRVVAGRKASDDLVDGGELSRGEHLAEVAASHPGDVLAHRTGQEVRVLRQVAQQLGAALRWKPRDLDIAEPDLPVACGQEADEQPAKRRLAGSGRTDHEHHLPGLEAHRERAQDVLPLARVAVADPFE